MALTSLVQVEYLKNTVNVCLTTPCRTMRGLVSAPTAEFNVFDSSRVTLLNSSEVRVVPPKS